MEMILLQCFLCGLFLTTVLCLKCSDPPPPCMENNDGTLEINVGCPIVEAVLAKFDCLQVFGRDHILMQRIAFVETEYGENYGTFGRREGGIWGLEEEKFNKLNEPEVMAALNDTDQMICSRSGYSFYYDVRSYQFLSVPFFSGLAARLYLLYLEKNGTNVPFNGSLEEQGNFWSQYYHTYGLCPTNVTATYFIAKNEKVIVEGCNDCKINVDILFLLDTSSSIPEEEFSKVQDFVVKFVEDLRGIGSHNQVGVITFSDYANVVFHLDNYTTESSLKDAIRNITFSGGFTNLPEGLCYLVEGFREENGARPMSAEVLQIAIIITDGKSSDDNYVQCRHSDTTYIEERKKLDCSVAVYVIGVTNEVNDVVLRNIASTPYDEYARHLDSFNGLPRAEVDDLNDLCERASICAKINQSMNGTLDIYAIVRYHYLVPDGGITVEVCVSEGYVKVYGSVTIPNPNSALYSWTIEVKHKPQRNGIETCRSYFFQKTTHTTAFEATSSSKASASPREDPDALNTDQTLYISLVGVEDYNRFILNGMNGNTCDECTPDGPTTSSPTTPPTTPPTTAPTTAPTYSTDSKIAIAVATTISGFALIILCIFISIVLYGFFVHYRKKMSRRKEEEYNLMDENTDSENTDN